MKDWLHDDDRELAHMLGISVQRWRKIRHQLIKHGLLREERHPAEGAILRATHPEHIVAIGQLMEEMLRP